MVGAELMAAELFESLVHAGHSVHVYADLAIETYERNGVYVQPRSAFSKVKRTADIVYSHPDLGTIGFIAAGLHRIPYVGAVHNIGSLNTWHLKHHKPDLVVWNSESTRAHHKGEGGLIVRPPLYPKQHATNPGESVTLINLIDDKGAGLFIKLARAMPAHSFFGIAGGYGYQRKEDAALAGAEVWDSVPHISMRNVWSKTKLLLVPSKEEAWGRVAAEALCSGIPVLAAPTPGLKECLGEAGIFLDRDDPRAWREAIELLMTDPKAYALQSKKAKARANQLAKQTKKDLEAFVVALEQLASNWLTVGPGG